MRARKDAGPPRIFTRGDQALTPHGPGIFLGQATYEVIRLGVHAGRRQYVWNDPDRGGPAVVDGPLVFQIAEPGGFFIRGYAHDQMPAQKGERS